MPTVTVSDKGQVVIPAGIRRGLGIKPGTQLDFELEGTSIRVSLKQPVEPSSLDDGYGMLRAKATGRTRRLEDFDAAEALRASKDK
jgi:antitoxin PrlF